MRRAGLVLIAAMFVAVGAAVPASAAIITSGGGLVLVESGGTFAAGNLSAGATAFAPNIEGQTVGPPQPIGYGGAHTTTGVNNLAYGNTLAWLAGSAGSYVGLNLNGSFTIQGIAYGRDNGGEAQVFTDRAVGLVTLQYTTDPVPSLATVNWTTVGTMNYDGGAGDALRHRFNFTPVTATGIRLVTAVSGRGIDEIELYNSTLPPPPSLKLAQIGGTIDANNLARPAVGATPFAKDNLQPGGQHDFPKLNDQIFGNTNSWIGASANTFAGISFASAQTIASIAWGRDNGGEAQVFIDRADGPYTVQYTTVANPNQFTPDSAWTSFQTIFYPNAPVSALRHRYNFTPISGVTGVRIAGLNAPTAIDEIELYSTTFTPPPLTSTVIQDETIYATGLAFVGNPIPAEPAPGDGQYHHANGPGQFTWSPLLNSAQALVEVSWGVSSNHTQDADYFFDPDGSGPLAEIALRQNVNQTLLNDQQTASGSVVWSGFLPIGVVRDLSVDSMFRVVGNPVGVSPQALSSAVWRFTAVPEPSTFVLGALGLAALGWIGWRRR